jgi:hypothetical protein
VLSHSRSLSVGPAIPIHRNRSNTAAPSTTHAGGYVAGCRVGLEPRARIAADQAIPFRGRSPLRTVSSRSEPLDSRSVIALAPLSQEGAGPDRSDRGHELQRVEWFEQERLDSSGQRLTTPVDHGNGEDRCRTVVSNRPAQGQTRATGNQQIYQSGSRQFQPALCRVIVVARWGLGWGRRWPGRLVGFRRQGWWTRRRRRRRVGSCPSRGS